MLIAFRSDASSQIGTGHVIRCLTLADALREEGAECQFVCREHEGHLIDYIRARGYEVHTLPKPGVIASFESDLAHADWLGVDWHIDLAQTQRALGSRRLDWLIADHYGLDFRWESALRSSCRRIMAIDDLADRRHECDLLLDQNFGSSRERYRSLVPNYCEQLYGPDYALLQPVYAARRAQMRKRNGEIRRALIYFGGGEDSANITGVALRAFETPDLARIKLDIVLSPTNAHRKSLHEAACRRGNTRFYSHLSDLADLMASADLSIGAGGATTWERCCLGLPSLIVSIANNQLPACKALWAQGFIEYLGHFEVITADLISERVRLLAEQHHTLRDLSERTMTLVDGKGVRRVVHAINKLSLADQALL